MNVNGVMFFSLKDEMCLNDVQVKMPRLSNLLKAQSIGQLQAGVPLEKLKISYESKLKIND